MQKVKSENITKNIQSFPNSPPAPVEAKTVISVLHTLPKIVCTCIYIFQR